MPRLLPFVRRPALFGWTLCLWLLAGCANPDLDAVRDYKDFIEHAKPSLQAMHKARQDLYDLNEPEKMAALFKLQLLPQVQQLQELAEGQKTPSGKIGEVHDGLKAALKHYVTSTKELVDKLDKLDKVDKQNGDSGDEREKAIVAWGQDDQKFGKEMSGLVDDLTRHLDDLRK